MSQKPTMDYDQSGQNEKAEARVWTACVTYVVLQALSGVAGGGHPARRIMLRLC